MEITSSGAEMEGVGRIDGKAVFVPGALPGEKVCVNISKDAGRYMRAELVKVLTPAPERTAPRCPYFEQCGGCGLMHMDYATTLRLKAQYIRDCLRRIGHLENIDALFGSMRGMDDPYSYRNRVQFPIGGSAAEPAVGFNRRQSHEVIDLPQGCMLVDRRIERARKQLANWMREFGVSPYSETTGRGELRHAVFRAARKGALMAIIVSVAAQLRGEEQLVARLKAAGCTSILINILRDRRELMPGSELFGRRFRQLYGPETYTDTILGARFELSAPSFFQINPLMTDALYTTAIDMLALRNGELLLDAYCGAGTIGITAAVGHRDIRLTGVESVEPAVADARRNAALNGIHDAEFHAGRCEKVITGLCAHGFAPDAMVVDPPRKGCDRALLEAAGELGRRGMKRLVYVSCDPATLARDVAILCQDGWNVERVEGVDMFPWTSHVETVCLLTQK